MDVKTAISERRSVRRYADKPVPDKLINELIEAARLAPSGNNTQPWRYKIIKSKEDKILLRENKIFKQDFVYTAPLLILCCSDPNTYPQEKFVKGLDDPNILRAVRDLAISSQNLVLRATELGLGTCYIGWMDKPRIKKLYKMPERYVVPYVIAVGYEAKDKKIDKTAMQKTSTKKNRKEIKEILI